MMLLLFLHGAALRGGAHSILRICSLSERIRLYHTFLFLSIAFLKLFLFLKKLFLKASKTWRETRKNVRETVWKTFFNLFQTFFKKGLDIFKKRCIIYLLRTTVRDMREWRNWQTRTFEGRVVHTVRVQVPFPAPNKRRYATACRFLFGVDNGSSRFFTRGLLARRQERRANTAFGFAPYDTRRLWSVSSPARAFSSPTEPPFLMRK